MAIRPRIRIVDQAVVGGAFVKTEYGFPMNAVHSIRWLGHRHMPSSPTLSGDMFIRDCTGEYEAPESYRAQIIKNFTYDGAEDSYTTYSTNGLVVDFVFWTGTMIAMYLIFGRICIFKRNLSIAI